MCATTEVVKQTDFFRLFYYQRRFAGPVLETVFADPDACFVGAQSEHTLKHDRTTTLVKIGVNDNYWVAKRYNTKNAWHAVRRCFTRSRAINCWEMSFALQAAGLRTADPVAVTKSSNTAHPSNTSTICAVHLLKCSANWLPRGSRTAT